MYQSSGQSITQETWTDLTWSTADFDTADDFDLTNNRFQPSVPGYYDIQARAAYDPTGTSTNVTSDYLRLQKNGTTQIAASSRTDDTPNNVYAEVRSLVYLNGTTDYIKVGLYIYGVGATTVSGADNTFFEAHLVPSTSGTPGITTQATGEALVITADNVPITPPTTVSSLPTAAAALKGARSFVTDANATTFASVVAGSGSNNVPVYCDGTNWRIG